MLYIYVRQNFETHLFLDCFYLVDRQRVIHRNSNFQTIFESTISSTIVKLGQCFFIVFKISYSTNIVAYILRFFLIHFNSLIFKSLRIFPITFQNCKMHSTIYVE